MGAASVSTSRGVGVKEKTRRPATPSRASLCRAWPDVSLEEQGAFGYVRAGAAVATSVMFALLLALGPSLAYGRAGPRPDARADAVEAATVTPPTIAPASE